MIFTPKPCRTRWEAPLVCGWVVLIDLLLLYWALRRPIGLVTFLLATLFVLSLPALGYWLYRTWAAFSLEYWVDRNAVVVRWANVRQTIPLQAVEQIVRGDVQDLGRPNLRHWPAPYLRSTRAVGMANVLMLATAPLAKCLVLTTQTAGFALSPRDPEGFLESLQRRSAMGPAQDVAMVLRRTSYAKRLFAGDRVGPALLGLGLLGVLLLVGLLMVNFSSLPSTIVVEGLRDGAPTLIRSRSELVLLPVMGFLAWLINGIWGLWMAAHKQPTGAYMLWGGAIVVQICSLLALVSLIR